MELRQGIQPTAVPPQPRLKLSLSTNECSSECMARANANQTRLRREQLSGQHIADGHALHCLIMERRPDACNTSLIVFGSVYIQGQHDSKCLSVTTAKTLVVCIVHTLVQRLHAAGQSGYMDHAVPQMQRVKSSGNGFGSKWILLCFGPRSGP